MINFPILEAVICDDKLLILIAKNPLLCLLSLALGFMTEYLMY